MIPHLRMETFKNHPPSPIVKDVSRNILSGEDRVETFVFANYTICSNEKKLIPQNPGYKPRHGYRSIHMFLSSQSQLLLFKVVS